MTITVVDGSRFPLTDFSISIDREIIKIASRSGNVMTVAEDGRGIEGTTATNHSSASDVEHGLTKQSTIDLIVAESTTIVGATGPTGTPGSVGGTGATGPLPTITASRAAVSNGSGTITAATTTATEIGYVAGVTSAIQTQIDGKATGAATDFVSVLPTDTNRNIIAAQNAGAVPLTLRQAGGQAVEMLKLQNENLSTIGGIDANGRFVAHQFRTESTPGGVPALYIQWPSGSSGTIVEIFKTSGGGNLLTINNDGSITGIYFTALEALIAAKMIAANNLSDVTNVSTARTNLGLGTMALNDNASYYTVTQVDGFFTTTNGNVTTAQAAATAAGTAAATAQTTADGAASSASSAAATASSAASTATSAASTASAAASDAATALSTANTAATAAAAAQTTANAAATPGAVTAEITAACATVSAAIPTNTNQLTNGAGFVTASDVSSAISSALASYFAAGVSGSGTNVTASGGIVTSIS